MSISKFIVRGSSQGFPAAPQAGPLGPWWALVGAVLCGVATFVAALAGGGVVPVFVLFGATVTLAIVVRVWMVRHPEWLRSLWKALREATGPLSKPVPAGVAARLDAGPVPRTVPVAVDEHRKPVKLALTHTLIVGATGAGKGSVLWAIIRALLAARRNRLVEFWAIDPKRAEFADLAKASLAGVFRRRAYEDMEIAELLSDLREQLPKRMQGRDFTPSQDRPWIIVFVDELSTVFDTFPDPKMAKTAEADLRVILSQGRAAGVIVIAAAQEATKAAVSLRDLFPQRVALRVATAAESDLVLGAGAVAAGANPHEITVATPSNDYASAGIGWVRGENGTFTRCRFPYTSDADIEAIAADFPAQPYQPPLI